MSLNANQVFIISSITRKGIAENIQDVREFGMYVHPTGPQEIAIDDNRLTYEICQDYARTVGDVDSDSSEDDVITNDLNAATFALCSMGYKQEDMEDKDEEKTLLLEEISLTESILKVMNKRLQKLNSNNHMY